MFRAIFIMAISIIVFVVSTYFVVGYYGIKFFNTFNSEMEYYNDMLGRDIVFKGDTLTIVDYSIIDNVFIMEDGQELNMNLIKKQEVIK